jgi:hypothetical protein
MYKEERKSIICHFVQYFQLCGHLHVHDFIYGNVNMGKFNSNDKGYVEY